MRTYGTFLFLASVALWSSLASAQDDKKLREFEKLMYGDLQGVKKFSLVHAHVKNTKGGSDANELGMTSDEMTNYLRLRFKNNFANIKLDTEDNWLAGTEKERSAKGYLWCGLWTVGKTYPVAYHVECRMGTVNNFHVVEDETLGYGNKEQAIAAIKKALDDMTASFATIFFRVRGDI